MELWCFGILVWWRFGLGGVMHRAKYQSVQKDVILVE